MRATFLLGPAGSGKTYRCLQEARAALSASAEGLPLLFIGPKQATYQLERQLLDRAAESKELGGFTRLRILSFERLARLIFVLAGRSEPRLLNEEGRVMVLRALLAQHESKLKLFRASAGAPGFAQELSRLLRDLHQTRCSSARLKAVIRRAGSRNPLNDKLADVALVLAEYEKWLKQGELQDADRLLELAAELLEKSRAVQFEAVWLDGFAHLTAQERTFLKALAPRCAKMTLAFCLDHERASAPWHSHWHLVSSAVCELRDELRSIKGLKIEIDELGQTLFSSVDTRFSESPELQHLERCWPEPRPYSSKTERLESVRLVQCGDPEAEATFVAREILRFVRQGGRFRQTAIVVRQLDQYYEVLRRVFLRYEIPFFLDRREPIAHHPLAELTRAALRTLAFNWRRQDWFCALKSGLVPATQNEIDQLENQALARGWEGSAWQNPLVIRNDPALTETVERLRQKLVRPFIFLSQRLGIHPTGTQLSDALRNFWKELAVESELEKWSTASTETSRVHLTVWEQLQQWIDTLALAFAAHSQSLKQWLPIIESGLGTLTVGAVPPVLDQVLLGAVDRSRNPDLQSVFVLGLNETVFPARRTQSAILTDVDRDLLENEGLAIGQNPRLQAAQERFFGYIACTRARQKLTITYALRDVQGTALNASSLVGHLQRLFPQLREPEVFELETAGAQAEHYSELISPLLRARNFEPDQRTPETAAADRELTQSGAVKRLTELPKLASILNDLSPPAAPELSRELAYALYGPVNSTSVSGLEKFASCPFWYFIDHGLRAKERERFDLDARQRGTFQHQVLERFHRHLKEQGRTWHSITQEQARAAISKVADELIASFEDGMLLAVPQNRFVAMDQKERLQRLIEVLIGWMKQYEFEPTEVELKFGMEETDLPAWNIQLKNGRALALRGSIDRVDLYRQDGTDEALGVVMDYKSSARVIDRVLMNHGIQLQLPAYLAALRQLHVTARLLAAEQLRPVGVFFVNLRGEYDSAANRDEVLADSSSDHKQAFQHAGLFDAEALDYLDNRNAAVGDQFNYKRNADGTLSGQVKSAMPSHEFTALLDEAEQKIREFGERLYSGEIAIDPFKKGALHACMRCHHASICRIDPWTHSFRNLKKDLGA